MYQIKRNKVTIRVKVLKKGAKKRNKVLTGSTCVLYLLLYCSDVYKLGRSVYHIGKMVQLVY